MRTITKRLLSLVLTLAMLLSLGLTVQAVNTAVTVTLNGTALELEAPAYIDGQDRTQVPASIGPQLGLTVQTGDGSVTFTKGEASLTFQDGAKEAGGVTMDTAADLSGEVGYVPLTYLAQFFGFQVAWNGVTRTAAVTSTAAEEETAVTKLPQLVYSELESLMAQQAAQYQTKDNVVPMLWQGVLEMDVQVGDAARTAKLYVPQGTPQGAMFVVMNVPEGLNAVSFMETSGWMDKADEEGFCLFVLEPAQGTPWGTLEEEQAYINAGISAAKAGKWLQPGPSMYLVGYGAMGTCLQKYAMENPLNIAGAVFLDASLIDAGYMASNGDVSFDTDTKTYGVTRKEVPVPVKIVESTMTEQAKAVADYWQAAANDKNAVERFAPEGGEILAAAVVTEEGNYDYALPATTDMIWDFMGQFYRYGGGVLSNAISWKVDYEEMGVEFRSFTDSQGIDRQYLVYIPEAYRGSGEQLPVVIAYHGASTSMRNFFENTLWYNIADEEGIMLVFPESTLVPVPPTLGGGEANPTAYRALWQVEDPELRYTDVVYAEDLLDQLIAVYPQVDQGRIYCTGHSMGCMMTHYLGSAEVSHRFAAMGATSGPLMAREETGSQTVPMFMTMAQYDMWSYDLNQDDTMTTQAVDMWLVRNGLAAASNVVEVRKTGATETYVEGRYNNSVWENEDGIPLFRYAWVTGKDHVNLPAENQLLWDEWFSQITLDTKTGVRAYQGQAIG